MKVIALNKHRIKLKDMSVELLSAPYSKLVCNIYGAINNKYDF